MIVNWLFFSSFLVCISLIDWIFSLKDQVQNLPQKAQNGAPKGAVATSLTSRKKKAKSPEPVLTINALKPSAIKPTSNTPKNQVKQTNAQPNQSEKYESAIQTARMIAKNTSHPKNKDVSDDFISLPIPAFFDFSCTIFFFILCLIVSLSDWLLFTSTPLINQINHWTDVFTVSGQGFVGYIGEGMDGSKKVL